MTCLLTNVLRRVVSVVDETIVKVSVSVPATVVCAVMETVLTRCEVATGVVERLTVIVLVDVL